jgi:hypothetical protein
VIADAKEKSGGQLQYRQCEAEVTNAMARFVEPLRAQIKWSAPVCAENLIRIDLMMESRTFMRQCLRCSAFF